MTFFCRIKLIFYFDDSIILVYFIIVNIGVTSRLSRYYNHLHIEDVHMCVTEGRYYDKVLLISVDYTRAEYNWPRLEHSLNGKLKCITAS